MANITSGQWEVVHNPKSPKWVATVWCNGQVIASLEHYRAGRAPEDALMVMRANAQLVAMSGQMHHALAGMAETDGSDHDTVKRSRLLAGELVALAVRVDADMHTPGPWTVSASRGPKVRRDIYAGHEPIAVCSPQRNTMDEVNANAAVIAAAPNMLRALKAISQIELGNPTSAIVTIKRLARENIAKPQEQQPDEPSAPPARKAFTFGF